MGSGVWTLVWTGRAQLSALAVYTRYTVYRGADTGGGGAGDCGHADVGDEFLGYECGFVRAVQRVGYDVSFEV